MSNKCLRQVLRETAVKDHGPEGVMWVGIWNRSVKALSDGLRIPLNAGNLLPS